VFVEQLFVGGKVCFVLMFTQPTFLHHPPPNKLLNNLTRTDVLSSTPPFLILPICIKNTTLFSTNTKTPKQAICLSESKPIGGTPNLSVAARAAMYATAAANSEAHAGRPEGSVVGAA
jgi:hypothetical protein